LKKKEKIISTVKQIMKTTFSFLSRSTIHPFLGISKVVNNASFKHKTQSVIQTKNAAAKLCPMVKHPVAPSSQE